MTSELEITQSSTNSSSIHNTGSNTNTSSSTNTSNQQQNVTTALQIPQCCPNHTKLQNLKNKKFDLEKKLNDKNRLLAQLIFEENSLLKLATENSNCIKSPIHYNGVSTIQPTNGIQPHMRHRKLIGTNLKLNENILNNRDNGNYSKKNDVNILMIDKNLQQQISENSLKLKNDLTQSKSNRKNHKQCYDVAQDKLKVIEKNLVLQQTNHEAPDNSIVRHNSMKSTLNSYSSRNSGKLSPSCYYPTNQNQQYLQHNHNHYLSKNVKIKKPIYLDNEYNMHCKSLLLNQSSSPTLINSSATLFNNLQYGTDRDVDHHIPLEIITNTDQLLSPSRLDHNAQDINNYDANNNQKVIKNDKLQIEQPHNQGLGGYWVTLENNEKMWCAIDNRFSSLDRKNNQFISKLNRNNIDHSPLKSTSLGNFDFAKAPDEVDSVSISSVNSENKKQKEKVWCETSLDSPILPNRSISNYSTIVNQTSSQHHSQMYSSHNLPTSSPAQTNIATQNHFNQTVQHIPENTFNSTIISNVNGYQPNSYSSNLHNHNTLPINHNNISHHREHRENKPKLSSHSMSLPNRNINNPIMIPNPHNNSHINSSNTYDDFYLNTSTYQSYYHDNFHSPRLSPSQVSIISKSPMSNNNHVSSPQHHHQLNNSNEIHLEQSKNVTVIQEAKFRPYKEISKPFEMSDFYKYSTKFRQQNNININNNNNVSNSQNNGVNSPMSSNNNDGIINSNVKQRDELITNGNQPFQKVYYQPLNPSICQPINYD